MPFDPRYYADAFSKILPSAHVMTPFSTLSHLESLDLGRGLHYLRSSEIVAALMSNRKWVNLKQVHVCPLPHFELECHVLPVSNDLFKIGRCSRWTQVQDGTGNLFAGLTSGIYAFRTAPWQDSRSTKTAQECCPLNSFPILKGNSDDLSLKELII